MNIELVRSFLTVVEEGSLTRAADKLFITQPTLSHRILALETQLNAQLIIRKKGMATIQLTPAGAAFIPQAEKWMHLDLETKSIVNSASRETLFFATSTSAGGFILNEFFAIMLNNFSDKCSVTLSLIPSSTIYQRLELQEIDCAVLTNIRLSNTAISLPIAREDFVLIVSKETPLLTDKQLVSPDSLDPHNELYTAWDSNYNIWHDYWFGADKAPLLHNECILSLPALIKHAGAWAIVPKSIALSMRENVTIYELSDPPSPRTFHFVTQRKQKQPYCDQIKELLIDYLEKKDGIQLL